MNGENEEKFSQHQIQRKYTLQLVTIFINQLSSPPS